MLDLVIMGGQVVTSEGVRELDVGVQAEKIAALGWPGTLTADVGRVVDARGKIVIPGGIDLAASSRTRTSASRCRSSGRDARRS